MPTFTYRKKRIFGLDIIRAVAILSVVYTHGYLCFAGLNLQPKHYLLPLILDGPTIFFVLSGFLVGSVIIKLSEKNNLKTSANLFRFWKRRWLRTLPNYYIILLLLLFYQFIFLNDGYPFWLFIKYVFFIQNFASFSSVYIAESWSLAIEEWFYFLFPILFLALYYYTNKTRLSILIATGLFLTIPLLLRLIYYYNGIGSQNMHAYYRETVLLRLDSIGYGIIGAYANYYHKALWLKYKNRLFAIGLSLILLVKILITLANPPLFYSTVLQHSILPLLVLLCLPFLCVYQPAKITILQKIITHISVIAYSMYLINLTPMLVVILPHLKHHFPVLRNHYFILYALYWLLTIAGSYLLYIFIENPIMKWRDRVWER